MSGQRTWLEHYAAIKKAQDDGFIIVWSDENTLLLDLDVFDEENLKTKIERLKCFGVEEVERWESKTPSHWHVKLRLAVPQSSYVRIILEMYLGSDMERGLMQTLDYLTPANACVLFKPGPKE